MTIKELTTELFSAGLNQVQIANLFGVSVLQVKLYHEGKTKKPGVRVALAISRHITYKGEPLIISPFEGKQDVLNGVSTFETQSAQIVRDRGTGNYELN